jgi:nucleoside-diphosphate-sugar epimerase
MPDWGVLRDARIFVTGGTGFLGASLIESIVEADCGARLVLLTRDAAAFRAREPMLASRVDLVEGDVRSFSAPGVRFTHVIHAAAETTLQSAETIVEGTARVLEFARHSGCGRMLLVSSGAVYGPQPAHLSRIPESYACRPSTPYGQAKWAAEQACLDSGVPCVLARCFSFAGRRMPLDGGFAFGNFVRDALARRAIEVCGDGSDVRSYMDAADCAEWLWTLLLHGTPGGAYNVGSDAPVTIAQLAQLVATQAPCPVEVRILGQEVSGVSRRYVPSIVKAREELGLNIRFDLKSIISRAMQSLAG